MQEIAAWRGELRDATVVHEEWMISILSRMVANPVFFNFLTSFFAPSFITPKLDLPALFLWRASEPTR